MKVVMIPGLEDALKAFVAETRKDLEARLSETDARLAALDARVKELEKKGS